MIPSTVIGRLASPLLALVALGTMAQGGDLLVTSWDNSSVIRYDGTTGAYIGQFVGPGNGMVGTETGNFGPDGNFYLASGGSSQINRYNGETGAFIDVFVAQGAVGNLNDPHDLAWGPDGNLYATSFGNNRVKRYDGTTGAFIDNYITPAGGLLSPHGIDFRPDGMLYVASFTGNAVQQFDTNTGTLAGSFITQGSGGLNGTISLAFLTEDTRNLSAVGEIFTVFGATPGQSILFLFGVGVNIQVLPCNANGVLWVKRRVVMGTGIADASGIATVTYPVPANLHGLPVVMQAIALNTCRTSDAHA